MGMLMTTFGVTNPIILLVAALIVGTTVGIVNGLLLTKLKLPHPFVSTLGMKFVLAGLALFVVSTRTISGFPDAVTCRRRIFWWANRYNTRRRHSACGYQAPFTYETSLAATLAIPA